MTTRKAPTKTRTPARPAGKTRKAGQPYTVEAREEAVAQLAAEGMAATHRATGIPKSTLTRWGKAAGVDLEGAAKARTAAAVEATRARAAEVKATTVELLEQHVGQAGDYLATVAGVNALAARLIAQADPKTLKTVQTIGGLVTVVEDPAADEVIRVARALGELPLAARDAEGILTRAIHDLALLNGEATERGELRVEFTVPRPVAVDPTEVLELPAAPE